LTIRNEPLNRRWSQPPVTAAGSPLRDRLLDGALDQRLPQTRLCANTALGARPSGADTDGRLLEAHSPRLQREANRRTYPRRPKTGPLLRREPEERLSITTFDPKA
jgi:hypothetical protein